MLTATRFRQWDAGVPEANTPERGAAGIIRPIRGTTFGMWHDLRYGVRLLVAKPAFSCVAILTLAIGIGANTAIFSAVTALLVRPLPIEDPGRLVFGLSMREGWDPFGTALVEYAAMRDSASFASSGIANFGAVTLVGHDEPERMAAAAVSSGYLRTLGTRPIAGRSIAA
jgi:hypothetical protein